MYARIIFEHDFSEVSIKGRQARGVILTRLPVHKISLKQKGGSTLGGRKVWFDRDILRLNYDGRGEYLGEFQSDDSILIVLNNGDFYTTNFDLSNHYEDNVSIVEKFDPNKIWTAALYDADQQNYPYLKRFCFEASNRKQNYLGENKNNRLILLTDEYYPRLEVIFGGHDNFRDPLNIDADEFIAVKGFKAKENVSLPMQWRRSMSLNQLASPNPHKNNRKFLKRSRKIWTRTAARAKATLLMKSPGR